MKPWIKDSTAADDAEVARLNPALTESVQAGVRQDSASSEEEIQALMRRLQRIEVAPEHAGLPLLRPLLLGGGLLLTGAAAAAVAAVAIAPALLAEPVSSPAGTLALAGGATHALTDSIEVSGLGELHVDRVHAAGADVSLVQGVARFDVDPAGADRELSVRAGDVDIQVFGTVFSVHRLGEEVEVKVERGEVGVEWKGQSFPVLTGQSWRRGEGVVAAAPAAIERVEVGEPGLAVPDVDVDVDVDADATTDADGLTEPQDASGAASPSAMARPKVQAGTTDAVEAAASTPSPCDVDAFSPECARTRLRNKTSSPESRYGAMKEARPKAAYNAETARTLVDNANQFLDQFSDSPYADDVRAFRVEGAFYGARASQTISFADAFLATAPAGHASIEPVTQWRRIASLRRDVIDAAQRDCTEADPHLAELVRLETGLRKDEARAHRGVCAFQLGDRDKAQEILRTIENEERLPVSLKADVRQAWSVMRAPSRDDR